MYEPLQYDADIDVRGQYAWHLWTHKTIAADYTTTTGMVVVS